MLKNRYLNSARVSTSLAENLIFQPAWILDVDHQHEYIHKVSIDVTWPAWINVADVYAFRLHGQASILVCPPTGAYVIHRSTPLDTTPKVCVFLFTRWRTPRGNRNRNGNIRHHGNWNIPPVTIYAPGGRRASRHKKTTTRYWDNRDMTYLAISYCGTVVSSANKAATSYSCVGLFANNNSSSFLQYVCNISRRQTCEEEELIWAVAADCSHYFLLYVRACTLCNSSSEGCCWFMRLPQKQ